MNYALPIVPRASVWDYAIRPLITLDNAALVLLAVNAALTMIDFLTLLNARIPQ